MSHFRTYAYSQKAMTTWTPFGKKEDFCIYTILTQRAGLGVCTWGPYLSQRDPWAEFSGFLNLFEGRKKNQNSLKLLELLDPRSHMISFLENVVRLLSGNPNPGIIQPPTTSCPDICNTFSLYNCLLINMWKRMSHFHYVLLNSFGYKLYQRCWSSQIWAHWSQKWNLTTSESNSKVLGEFWYSLREDSPGL